MKDSYTTPPCQPLACGNTMNKHECLLCYNTVHGMIQFMHNNDVIITYSNIIVYVKYITMPFSFAWYFCAILWLECEGYQVEVSMDSLLRITAGRQCRILPNCASEYNRLVLP